MLGKLPKFGTCNSNKAKIKMVDESEFDEFLSRISKTLYYGEKLEDQQHLSYPVIELAAEIYSDLKTGKSIDRLYLNEATEMTRTVNVNPCYMVLALLYIERLKDCNAQYLNDVAPSQLFLISLVLASKFCDDTEYELSLSMFHKFEDWSASDIVGVELDFLNAISWNVHVTEREFYEKLTHVEKLLATKSTTHRKWLTYTEMNTLMDETLLTQLTSLLITVSAVCLTTYTAGVFTLFASSAIASHVSATAALAILSTTAQLSLLRGGSAGSSNASSSNFQSPKPDLFTSSSNPVFPDVHFIPDPLNSVYDATPDSVLGLDPFQNVFLYNCLYETLSTNQNKLKDKHWSKSYHKTYRNNSRFDAMYNDVSGTLLTNGNALIDQLWFNADHRTLQNDNRFIRRRKLKLTQENLNDGLVSTQRTDENLNIPKDEAERVFETKIFNAFGKSLVSLKKDVYFNFPNFLSSFPSQVQFLSYVSSPIIISFNLHSLYTCLLVLIFEQYTSTILNRHNQGDSIRKTNLDTIDYVTENVCRNVDASLKISPQSGKYLPPVFPFETLNVTHQSLNFPFESRNIPEQSFNFVSENVKISDQSLNYLFENLVEFFIENIFRHKFVPLNFDKKLIFDLDSQKIPSFISYKKEIEEFDNSSSKFSLFDYFPNLKNISSEYHLLSKERDFLFLDKNVVGKDEFQFFDSINSQYDIDTYY